MTWKSYPSDLIDAQWKYIEPFGPTAKLGDGPREHDMRDILDAIFYLARTGCAWRMLPLDFPPWRTVYEIFA